MNIDIINYHKDTGTGLLLISDSGNFKHNGLHFIKMGEDNNCILTKIYDDESQIVSNIDADNNYIKCKKCNHKLYKAGSCNKDLYYCYDCGNYIWK